MSEVNKDLGMGVATGIEVRGYHLRGVRQGLMFIGIYVDCINCLLDYFFGGLNKEVFILFYFLTFKMVPFNQSK